MHRKIVQTGDFIEMYTYEKEPSPKRFTVRKKRRKLSGYRSKRSVNRARQTFYRKVRASLSLGNPYMLTLTTVNTTDIKKAYSYIDKFRINIAKKYSAQIKYIGVPEYQKRGAVHFHILLWGITHETYLNERNTRDLQALWGRGWLDILSTDGSPKIAGYMAKYMSKAMQDNRLYGQKSYFGSRGLLRPVQLNTATQIAYFEEEFGKAENGDSEHLTLLTERTYSTMWLGRCHYKSFTSKKLYAQN